MATSCLSFHAPYRCRHAGACCAAPWQVRADDHVVHFVRGSSLYSNRVDSLFIQQAPRPGAQPELSVAKGVGGVCVFRENRRCAIHAQAGESSLPIGCRHYPRVVRIDPEQIALSLSHYCPTAASLLASDEPIRVITAAPPLELSEPVEGLDARDALPPLLRPGVLMDVEAYTAWELAAVDALSLGRPEAALAKIAAATDALRHWTPGTLPLDQAVHAAFASSDAPAPAWTARGIAIARALNKGPVSLSQLPDTGHRIPDTGPQLIANYLAARVFGNWIAYQGRGLRTIVTWLYACYDIVCTLACHESSSEEISIPRVLEAIRHADYVMLHSIDSQDFANAAIEVEA